MPPWGAGPKPKAKTVPWDTPNRDRGFIPKSQGGLAPDPVPNRDRGFIPQSQGGLAPNAGGLINKGGGRYLPVPTDEQRNRLRMSRAVHSGMLDNAGGPPGTGGPPTVRGPMFDPGWLPKSQGGSGRERPPSGRGAVSTGGFGQGVGAASAPSYNMSDILKAATSGAATAPAASRVAQPSQQELMRAATSGASTHPAARSIQQQAAPATTAPPFLGAGPPTYATPPATTAPPFLGAGPPTYTPSTPYAPTQQELMFAATSGAATHPAAGMFGTRVPGLVDDPADKKFVEPGNVRAHLPGTGTVGGGGGFSADPADKKFVEPGNVRAHMPGTGAGGSGGGGFGGDGAGAGGGGAPAPIVRPNEGTVSPFGDGFGDLQRKMARYQFLEEKYGREGARYMTDIERAYKQGLRALPGTYNRRGMLDSGQFDRGGTELFADYYGDDYGALPRYLSTLGENLYGLDLGAYGTQDAYNVTGEADLQNRAKALIERMTNLNSPVAG